jgi:hypothetical protein
MWGTRFRREAAGPSASLRSGRDDKFCDGFRIMKLLTSAEAAIKPRLFTAFRMTTVDRIERGVQDEFRFRHSRLALV